MGPVALLVFKSIFGGWANSLKELNESPNPLFFRWDFNPRDFDGVGLV